MPASNNTILLDGCIEEFVTQNELERREDEIFELFSLAQITQKLDLSFDEMVNSIVDGGKDGGIDTFLIVLDDQIIQNEDDLDSFIFSSSTQLKIYIGQAKTTPKFAEVGLDKLITSLPLIYNLDLQEDQLLKRFNVSLTEKIHLFKQCWEKVISKNGSIEVIFYYATRANELKIKGTYQDKVEQIKDLTRQNIHNVEVSFESLSAKELLSLFSTPKTTTFEIVLKEIPTPVEYRESKFGYIGVSKLKNFYNFITDEEDYLRENIFENNVRHFQGNVDVNKKIQHTISEDVDRDFWWLNNGVTIISSLVRPVGKKLMLENPQIVNGLQTSFTLYNTYEEQVDDDRSILVKIIESTDKETIDKIISSTNSQSPVSPTLLRATEELQRNIELLFLTKGYYYDRRKNYYKNQGKPASKIFNIQSTAQAVEAIKRWSPSTARSKPTTLIKTDSSYNEIFNDQINFDVYLQCCLIVQVTQQYINRNLEDEEKSLMRNYTYHLARVVTALITNSAYYNSNAIAAIDISTIETQKFIEAKTILEEAISSYQEDNPGENIINISKSKNFSNYLSQHLITILS